MILTRGSGDEAMAFYCHFQPSNDLPDLSGLLSASLNLAAITRLREVPRAEVSKVRMTHGTGQYSSAILVSCHSRKDITQVVKQFMVSRVVVI